MTEETKKRYVAFICSSEPGMQSIYFEVDLGENKSGITVDDILKITKDARLGQYGGDISQYEIDIRPIYSLEGFKKFCDEQRAKEEKSQQAILKELEEIKQKKKEEREKIEVHKKEKEEREKKRMEAREGKDLVYEVFEIVDGENEYRKTFDNEKNLKAFLKKNENCFAKIWMRK